MTPLDPDVAELVAMLQEMASRCRAHRDEHFAIMLDRSRIAMERRDPYGLLHFLGIFGGKALDGGELANDAQFLVLSGKAFRLANRLHLEQEAWERSSESVAESSAPASSSTLLKPIGIITAGGVFTPIVPAGQPLPHTRSQTFGGAASGAGEVAVILSQQDTTGAVALADVRVPIPVVTGTTPDITVTLTISAAKVLRIKTTVNQTAESREFGPWLVH